MNDDIAVGYNAKTNANNSANSGSKGGALAFGIHTNADGDNAVAIGNQANATGNSSIALAGNSTGTGAVNIGYQGAATGDSAVSMGYYAKASANYSTAVGSQAKAGGIQSAALGANANASANYSAALGGNANASANYSSAVGSNSNASGDYSFAGGYSSNASSESAIALGNQANASGESAIAQGYNASASSESSIAIGTETKASGTQSIAIGSSNNVSGSNSSAMGNNNTIASAAQNTSVLGNNVNATTADSVILGNASQGDASVVACTTATVNNITYTGFAGTSVDSGEYVSVGAKDDERKIINVAAGNITADSTEAINGSQLYIVANNLTDYVNNVSWKLGDNSGTKVDDVKAGDQVNFVNGTNTVSNVINNGTVSNVSYSVKVDNSTIKTGADGNITANTTNLTVNGNGTVNVGGDGSNLVNATTVTNAINNASFVATIGTNTTTFANQDGKSNYTVKAGETLIFQAGKNLKVKQENGTFTYATEDNVSFDNVTVGNVTIDKDNGINAGNMTITNVSNGTNATDAVNLSQLNATKTEVTSNNKTVNVTSSTGDKGQTIYNVEVLTDGTTINSNSTTGKLEVVTGNTTTNSNGTATVANGSNSSSVATVGDIVNTINNVSWNITSGTNGTGTQTGTQSEEQVKAGEMVTLLAGDNMVIKQDGQNFTYSVSATPTFTNVTVNDTLTVGPVSINSTGINAGNTTITNVSNGTNATDAVNLSQLNATKTEVTSNNNTVNVTSSIGDKGQTIYNVEVLTDGTTINSNSTTGKLEVVTGNTTTNSNGTAAVANGSNSSSVATVGDIVNTINNVSWKLGDNSGTKVDDVKAGDQINFVNGTNTVANVTVTKNGTVSNVSYSVNVDNSTIKTDGDKIVANTTNLTVNDNGTVAVDTNGNGSNLVNATTVTNAINNASFVATIGSDSTDFEDQKGKSEYKVKAGETLKFQAGKNLKVKQENGTFTYATKDDVSFNSVKVGNVTINSTTGIDAGNTTITNVTAGTNATDAVNVSQLNSSVAASKEEVTSNNKSIKVNVTQNANGSNVFDLAVNTDGKTINTNSSTGALEVVSGNTTTNSNGTAKVTDGSNITDVATIGDIVNTINNVSWNAIAGKVDGTNGEVEGNATAKVKAGETVTYNAGKNIKIAQNGTTFNLSTTDDVNFNSVKVGNVTINSTGIDAGNTQITNVTAGTNGTDAVNLDQLNKSVAASKEEVTSKDKSVTVNVSQNTTTGANIYDLAVNTDGTTINTNSTTGKLEVITGGSQVNANGTAAAKSGDENKVATVGDIVNTVNNVSWNLTTSKSDGNVTGTTEEQIKAGEVVTIDAGKNINVTQSANKISIATNMNSTFDSVKVGNVTINSTGIDAGDTQITNVKAGTNGTDAVNLDQLNSSVAAAKTEVTSKDQTVNVTNSTGANGQTIYDLSVKTGSFNNTTNGSLVAGNDGFATVTDIINAVNGGYWKVGNNAGSETAQIKFGDQVNFVNGVGTKSNVSGANVSFDVNLVSGDKSVSITNNTDGSVNLSVNTTNVKNALAGNVTTNPNGTVKVADNTDGSNFVNATNVVNAINNSGWITNSTTATGGANETVINPGKAVNFEAGDNMQVSQSVDANGNVTYTYATKENVTFKNLNVTGDTKVNNFSVAANSTVDMGGNQITNVSAGTNGTDAVNVDQLKENITNINNNIANATESVKWKLTGNNDDANATTVGNQTVSFNNGTGTVAVVNGTNVTYNVDTGNITTNSTTGVASGDITPTKIATTGDVINAINNSGWRTTNTDGSTSLINPGDSVNYVNGNGTAANVTTKDGVTTVSYDVKTTNLTVNDNGTVAAPTDGSSVVNATTVANTVNNVSWNLHSTKVEGSSGKVTDSSDTKASKVKAGNTVNINAGNNIEITRKGKDVAIATSMNPTFDTVKIGSGDNATTISSDKSGISIAGNNGEARQIHNVKGGTADTDAVNVSQLKQSMGDVYNRINRNNKDLRAGIAGANAAAGLPQVYIPGKSMVAASAGTFKGQSAVAVGYSRASDNGKVILKLQGNANTQGDVGGSVGVGYQW
ncbi:YadA-like family protein [Necropsobacter massiliensis]|uniref:YadA-like family protein n=1 Tax=Necropsobacter massiliensis TaxID=1400001 RepID=UPI0005959EB6|nr:YadA-like family protein [Necropsobacter massiliensis]